MNIIDIPYEALLKILINIKNVKSLASTNKKLHEAINSLYELFINKFNKILPNWKEDVLALVEVLINKDDSDSIKFLYNNYGKLLLKNDITVAYILYIALTDNKKNIIKWALDDENFNDYNDLICVAAYYGNLKVVIWAHKRGATNLECVLKEAKEINSEELIEWVQNHINNTYLIEPSKQQTVKKKIDDIILDAIKKNNIDLLESLIFEGKTTLNNIAFIATYNDYEDVVRWAIANGATNIDEIAEVAAENGFNRIVELAIQTGMADLMEIALIAAREGYLSIVRNAVLQGASDINKITKTGAKYGRLNIVKYGFRHGANNYMEVIDTAKKYEHRNIVDYVREIKRKY